MKNSEIASARAQVALAKITGEPVSDDVREVAKLEMHDGSARAGHSNGEVTALPSWFDAVFELRRVQNSRLNSSRHRQTREDAIGAAILDADLAHFAGVLPSGVTEASTYLHGQRPVNGSSTRQRQEVS